MTYHSTATPGYFGHNNFGKYLWDSWPVNVAIARAQDQTNRHLQHLQ